MSGTDNPLNFIGGIAGTGINALANFGISKYFTSRQEAREDNSIQRRVKDLKESGINPLLAAGNPAASSASGTSNVDSQIGERIIESATRHQMNLQNSQLQQEIAERKRNIEWYKNKGLPSDNQSGMLMDLFQAMDFIKKNGISDVLDSIGKGIGDVAKPLIDAGLNAFGKTKDDLNHMGDRDDNKKRPSYIPGNARR